MVRLTWKLGDIHGSFNDRKLNSIRLKIFPDFAVLIRFMTNMYPRTPCLFWPSPSQETVDRYEEETLRERSVSDSFQGL